MIFFIVVLRALAAILITNSHYTGIYPNDIIANGGLLGDIIFFAVSGYCLANIKTSFVKWYAKRFIRIYIPVLIITVFYLIIGSYHLSENANLVYWLIYPTSYHFVISIFILYIPFYFLLKFDKFKNNIPLIMLVLFVAYLAVYLIFYDKSYYHIDTVREPMIRFLYFESMLLGAYFRTNDNKYRNSKWLFSAILSILLFVAYFASKILFSKMHEISEFQIVNQIIIFALLFFIFKLFSATDSKFEKMPKCFKVIIKFIADITLEIYLVQNVIIEFIRGRLPFPINWLLLTALIVFSAYILHIVSNPLVKLITKNILQEKKKN